MNTEHWLLLLLWILYCVLHSIFALPALKRYMERILHGDFKFYRPAYSIFAFVTLVLVLWYQYRISTLQLFRLSLLSFIPGIILAISGLVIMAICVRKYFYELSGLQALQQEEVSMTLQQKGLHRYVRHPLYFGTLLFIWGVFLIFPFLNNLIACAVITGYTLVGIELEEKKLKIEYGDEYTEYAKRVPKLIPRL